MIVLAVEALSPWRVSVCRHAIISIYVYVCECIYMRALYIHTRACVRMCVLPSTVCTVWQLICLLFNCVRGLLH